MITKWTTEWANKRTDEWMSESEPSGSSSLVPTCEIHRK